MCRRTRGRQVNIVADPDIEGALTWLLRRLSRLGAVRQVIVHGLLERLLQRGDGLGFIIHQGLDIQQFAIQAVVFRAGFNGPVVTTILQQIRHLDQASIL